MKHTPFMRKTILRDFAQAEQTQPMATDIPTNARKVRRLLGNVLAYIIIVSFLSVLFYGAVTGP